MSDIIFKDVSLTKRAQAWKFFHSNEERKLAKCQVDKCSEDFCNRKKTTWVSKYLGMQ